MKNCLLALFVIFGTTTIIGCGDDGGTDGGTGATDGGMRTPLEMQKRAQRAELLATADDFTFENMPDTPKTLCDVTLEAGSDTNGDASMINAAVEDASSFDIICLSPGTYAMDTTVTVSAAQNLMIKGIGDEITDVVLDFATQTTGRGIDVTTPGFWIENMTIKNAKGNGVEVKATNTAELPNVYRKLKVFWDLAPDANPTDCAPDDVETPELEGDPRRGNGAYSVYPTKSQYAIVEFCEVEDASDAGLYIGQVENGIVRYNKVHGNVAGLEVENSKDVVVYDNEVYDNAGGILALQEPGLDRLANENILIRDNNARDNNACNFARPNTTVANIPPGTGMMSFAGIDIEFRNNTVTNNNTTGLLIVSNVLLEFLSDDTEPTFPMGYDPYPSNIYSNNNDFSNNGTDPQGVAGDLLIVTGGKPWPDIVWAGFRADGVTAADAEICIGETEDGSFFDLTQDMCEEPAPTSAIAFGLCVSDARTMVNSVPAANLCTRTELDITNF